MENQTITPKEVKHLRVINALRRKEINDSKYSKSDIESALYWSCNKSLQEVDKLIRNIRKQ